MARAARTCSSCPTIIAAGSKCEACTAKNRQASDQRRGSSTERGYTGPGHKSFRREVLNKNPICVLCGCAWSTVADHWPHSRKQLVEQGLDPNDPINGRGLCKPCHDRETAAHQPGGWNIRDPRG